MHDITAIAAATPGATRSPNFVKHQRWYPTIYDLRRGAARRLPHFAYEYGDGGAGDDTGIKHNWAALDAVEMVPRYGVMPKLPPVNVELFGRKYSAPLGVAPMGSPIVVWPGADKLLAKAAQRARVPYTLGVAGGATIEEIAEIAPDVMWLQLYRFAKNDHAIGFDLMRRADAAGVHVLMLTLDVPVRTVRSREVKVGMGGGGVFKPDWRMVAGMVKCPGWASAFLQNTLPRFANIQPYAGPNAGLNDTIRFARKEMGGAFSWDEVKRYRDRWKRPMIVKGLLHPEDAEIAVKIGIDGILVSNHGGRQIEALPPPIDCVPAIAKAVGSRATVLFDSGVRSGTDVARALALGAQRGAGRQGVPVGIGRARRRGTGPCHRSDDRRIAVRARPDRGDEPGGGAERQSAASRRAAVLICNRGHGHARRRPVERAPLFCRRELTDVGDRRPDAHRGRRPSRQAQCAGAFDRAGAGRRQQHGDRGNRRHRRHHAGLGSGARDASGVGHGVRNLVRHAAARLSGAKLRPPLRPADRFGGRDAGGPRVLRCGGAGLFPVVSGRHVRLRLLCRRAQFLSVRRDRYRQRRLQAEGNLVRAGRRRDGRHRRIQPS